MLLERGAIYGTKFYKSHLEVEQNNLITGKLNLFLITKIILTLIKEVIGKMVIYILLLELESLVERLMIV